MLTARQTKPANPGQVLIRIDAKLRKRLKSAAALEGVSMRDFADQIISEGLDRKRKHTVSA